MAKFTVKEVEDQARAILLDAYENAYRFAPLEIYRAMQDGLLQTRSVRPESQYVNCLLVDLDFTLPADGSDSSTTAMRSKEVNMELRWREAIVYYIVYRMYLKDDPDTQNAELATQYLNLYNMAVKS